MQTHDTPEKSYDLERLIFFTDGVFAIVITLLVIQLHPPARWDGTMSGLLNAQWRALLAYLVSFFAVGGYWNSHRRLFARVVRFTPGLVLFNLMFLAVVVLQPFAAELIFQAGPHGEPFAIYLGLIAAIGAAQTLLWAFAAFVGKVVDPRLERRDRLVILGTMLLAPTVIGFAAWGAEMGWAGSGWLWLFPVLVAANVMRRRLLIQRNPA